MGNPRRPADRRRKEAESVRMIAWLCIFTPEAGVPLFPSSSALGATLRYIG